MPALTSPRLAAAGAITGGTAFAVAGALQLTGLEWKENAVETPLQHLTVALFAFALVAVIPAVADTRSAGQRSPSPRLGRDRGRPGWRRSRLDRLEHPRRRRRLVPRRRRRRESALGGGHVRARTRALPRPAGAAACRHRPRRRLHRRHPGRRPTAAASSPAASGSPSATSSASTRSSVRCSSPPPPNPRPTTPTTRKKRKETP